MQPDWVPDGLDIDRPSVARIYDYLLGGSHNFAADRALARQAIEAIPDLPVQAATNRAFMHRAVRFLVDAGVTQFLDLGSGIPTLGNVHEIAQAADPQARVAYVDIDDVAVIHSQHLLADNPNAIAVRGDLRRPAEILADAEVSGLLDLSRPVAVLAIAVLHAISDDDDPAGIIAALRDALRPGSYLAMAHGVNTRVEDADLVVDLSKRTTTPMTLRTPEQVQRLFDGFDLVDPGLVWAPLWRPESPHEVPDRPERSGNLAGVGRKP
ncbi:SAM-dependent methyltransferase [Dactylosporangium sp. CA-092794]|uniref:SAM-dependent methyltransferase n=1 Tax=Dactylosporangium sp. CA-092794 TaxID=3239929 RepID=UPI003D926F09